MSYTNIVVDWRNGMYVISEDGDKINEVSGFREAFEGAIDVAHREAERLLRDPEAPDEVRIAGYDRTGSLAYTDVVRRSGRTGWF